jgi:hypothetical protein
MTIALVADHLLRLVDEPADPLGVGQELLARARQRHSPGVPAEDRAPSSFSSTWTRALTFDCTVCSS